MLRRDLRHDGDPPRDDGSIGRWKTARLPVALALLAAGALAVLALNLAAASGDSVFSWKRSHDLGLKDGRLAPCRRTPNCVSSQADPADAEHYVAPVAFRGEASAAIAAARRAVEALPRSNVIRHEANYLYAEFTSRLMRFVDDVEFAFDEQAGLLHVRSASRLGRRDFGVNRGRVEALRSLIAGRNPA